MTGARARAFAFAVVLSLAVVAGPAAARAQESRLLQEPEGAPGSRVLRSKDTPAFARFDELVKAQAGQTVGDRLPRLPEAEGLHTGIYVTVAVQGVFVWDKLVVPFEHGAFPRAALASCPEICAVPMRDAAARALGEHVAWLKNQTTEDTPRFVVIADRELAYVTLLIALRSLTAASPTAPAAMDLVVTTPKGLGAIPVYLPPPGPIPVRAVANPLLFEVEIGARGWEARASRSYLAEPPPIPNADALAALVGDLHSRDPAKKVVFISARMVSPVKALEPVIATCRKEYPVVVLKIPGPIATKIVNP